MDSPEFHFGVDLSGKSHYAIGVSGHSGQNDEDTDIEFVKNFTPSDFQAKNFTPSISPNFNSFSKNGEIYTAGKNFTLPLALTGWTNSTSA